MRTNKQLRDFVRSHEVRYLAIIDNYSFRKNISVKKVYKVDVEGQTQWVFFSCATLPKIIGEYDVKHNLFKTREEAEARAVQMRKEREVKKKKEAEARKKILDKAASILHDNFYNMTDKDNKLKDEYKEIYAEAEDMVLRYGYKPDESEVLRRYVKKLETYIMTGMIVIDNNTSINKAAISRIDKGSMKLIDGTIFNPGDECVLRLLHCIAGL